VSAVPKHKAEFVDVGAPAPVEPVLRRAGAITPRTLEPLWGGVLWIGKPTLLVGDPGLGKSLVTVDIAARVSRGVTWPCESAPREPGNVLMLSAEDDPDDTIVPRLIAAGADLERITFLDGVREHRDDGTHEHPVSLDAHMHALRAAVSRDVRLVIVDPVSAFLGRTDSHNNAEVRSLLAALGRLAAEMRFAVLVVSHLNKVTGTSAVYRITGSLAFVAAARAVFAIARDPEDHNRRLILPVKSNLGPDSSGYSYTVCVADNDAPCVQWGAERVTRTVEEILAAAPTPREQAVLERGHEVRDWLRAKLTHEPQQASSMWTAAEVAGYSRRDVERAKRALGVTAEPLGYRGAWHWRLPRAAT
jgi:KaiC/GvpD/RAD55 family RecA-like ATPase